MSGWGTYKCEHCGNKKKTKKSYYCKPCGIRVGRNPTHQVKNGRKFCPNCRRSLPPSKFSKRKNKTLLGREKLSNHCKECIAAFGRSERARKNRHKRLLNPVYRLKRLKKHAIKLKVPCHLTASDVKKAIDSDSECYYCGIKSGDVFFDVMEPPWVGRKPLCLGFDRIIPEMGYIRENVVLCCFSCNELRGRRFSKKEMKLIGSVVSQIRKLRRERQ